MKPGTAPSKHRIKPLEYKGKIISQDPMGERKKQDDTLLALRNMVMKDTLHRTKIAGLKTRIK